MFTIGADPEFILSDGQNYVSSIGLIGGTKRKPLRVEEGALQEDNVLAEINIEPCTNEETFCNRIDKVLAQLKDKISPLSISTASSAYFPEDAIKSKKAQQFGCDPDLNAWTLQENPTNNPFLMGIPTFRSASGNIHIGIEVEDALGLVDLVKWLDLILGTQEHLVDPTAINRKILYGQAGAFRIKEYGVEYRTVGNFWVHTPALRRWAYNCCSWAISKAKKGFPDSLEDETIEAVNTGNRKLIKELQDCADDNLRIEKWLMR